MQQHNSSPFILFMPVWAWILLLPVMVVVYPAVVLLRLIFRGIGMTRGTVTVPSMDAPWWRKPEQDKP